MKYFSFFHNAPDTLIQNVRSMSFDSLLQDDIRRRHGLERFHRTRGHMTDISSFALITSFFLRGANEQNTR